VSLWLNSYIFFLN